MAAQHEGPQIDVSAKIRALVRVHGASETGRLLRMPRETITSLGAEARVKQGTLELARRRLQELGGG